MKVFFLLGVLIGLSVVRADAEPKPAQSGTRFRGVESVDKSSAGIDDTIRVRIRDLDGWLLNEIERKRILGETHFKDNQYDLFLARRQEAHERGVDYADLMEKTEERLNKEFKKLDEELPVLTARKAALRAGAAATAQATAALEVDEKKWKDARAKLEGNRATEFKKLDEERPVLTARKAALQAEAAATEKAMALDVDEKKWKDARAELEGNRATEFKKLDEEWPVLTARKAAFGAEKAATEKAMAALDEDEKKWKNARAALEADQAKWYAEWQAWKAMSAIFAEVKENLYLILDNSRLTHVKARNPFDKGGDLSAISYHDFEFVLKQHPADKPEWDKLFRGTTRFVAMPLRIGFDLDGKSYTFDSEVGAGKSTLEKGTAPAPLKEGVFTNEFVFVTYGTKSMAVGLGLVVFAFVAFLYLAGRTELVRDSDLPKRPDGLDPFSLARCQMAFWFFLFAAAYIFLWVVKRETDTLTEQCLILLGISTGTTLGAAVISKTASPSPSAMAMAAGPNPKAATDEERQEYLKRPAIQRFFEDLLTDQGKITFYRFQMVVWTLVLGMVFIKSVCFSLQMPVFGTNELTLMGISAGTYIGFKLPEARDQAKRDQAQAGEAPAANVPDSPIAQGDATGQQEPKA